MASQQVPENMFVLNSYSESSRLDMNLLTGLISLPGDEQALIGVHANVRHQTRDEPKAFLE